MGNLSLLAEAVVADLNNEAFSLDFVARRLYRPRFEPADLKTLQVSVVPRSLVIEAASRAEDSQEYRIDVAVQQKLDTETAEEMDPLLGLVEEIARYFRLRRPAAMPSALCVKVANEPVYAVEHLNELRCFTSIITLSFRMVG